MENQRLRSQEMAQFRRRYVPPRDGMSLALSIDPYVQHQIELELADIADKFVPETACIIVTDPYSGFILGLANYLTFDPNRYTESDESAHKLGDDGSYRAGIYIYDVAASAVSEERLVSVDTHFDCSIPTLQMPSGYVASCPRIEAIWNFDQEDIVANRPIEGLPNWGRS